MYKLKKLNAITMIIIIVVSLIIPIKVKATYSESQLRQMYPGGMQWNDKYKDGSSECAGFAYLIYDSYYGIGPKEYNKKITDVEQAQPGDIVRYNNHSVFILTRNGEDTTVVECNYDRNNHVRWDEHKSMSEFRNNFEYIYKAPYVFNTPAPKVGIPQNVSVDTSKWVEVRWNQASNCVGYLIQIYDISGQKVKEIKVNKNTTTSQAISGLGTGDYTVRVYAIGIDGSYSSGYGSAKFSCIQEASSYSLNRKNLVLEVGETFDYVANFYPEGSTAYTYLYLDAEANKSVLQIENQMTVRGLKEGETKVFFIMRLGTTTRSESFLIKVINPLRFKDNEPRTIELGENIKLDLRSKSEIAGEVKWSSSNKNVATVDENGNVTPLKAGKTTITAQQSTWTSNNYISGTTKDSCTITVIDPNVYATGISLNKKSMTIENVGDKDLLVATITPNNTTDKTVTWTSNNTNVATVDQKGYVTAKGEGIAIVRATTSNGKTASCTVTVPKQVKCNLNYNHYTFTNLNDKLQLNASLSNSENTTFTYKSSNEKILKVNSKGQVTPIKPGFAYVTVTDNKYKKVATCDFYVQTPVVLSDGSKGYVGDINRDGLFNSSDASIILDAYKNGATNDQILIGDINDDGIINSTDSAMILDIFKAGIFSPGRYYKITGIKLNKNELSLNTGKTENLKATITPENTTDSTKLTWNSSNKKVATVDGNGKITALAEGTTTITVETANGKKATCNIKVTEVKEIKGDINKDGLVNINDVNYSMRGIVNKVTLTEEEKQTQDVNNDGAFNINDINKIVRFIVGKIKEL